jgi:hypothetical protein
MGNENDFVCLLGSFEFFPLPVDLLEKASSSLKSSIITAASLDFEESRLLSLLIFNPRACAIPSTSTNVKCEVSLIEGVDVVVADCGNTDDEDDDDDEDDMNELSFSPLLTTPDNS